MSIRISAFLATALAFLTLGAFFGAPLQAHEGHDHGAVPAAAVEAGAPRLEATSAAFELVAVSRNGLLTIWLDRFETNAPVTEAAIEVETPLGPQTAAPTPDGAFTLPAPWAQKPGRYDLIFTVMAGGDVDVLTGTLTSPEPPLPSTPPPPSPAANYAAPAAGLGGLALGALLAVGLRRRPLIWAPALGLIALAAFGAVRLFAHEGHDHGAEAPTPVPLAGDRAQILADGSVFLPKHTQRILALRTALVREESFAKRVELPGRIIPDPNGAGLVQAAAVGRLSPPPDGFPRLGARVSAGDVLAYVATPFLAIDQSTMHQQQGDLDQQISILERRISRFETLAKTGAVEALSFDAAAPAGPASARAPDGRDLDLAFVGAGLADRNQAAALQFAVKSAPPGLRPGQFVTVFAQTGDSAKGLAAPRASVVRRTNGESVVYAHDGAERFRPVVVRTQPLDAERVLIVGGLEPGRRIVTQAAELLNQVR